jgi:hypothetical protein
MTVDHEGMAVTEARIAANRARKVRMIRLETRVLMLDLVRVI